MLIQKKGSLLRFEGKKAVVGIETGEELVLLKDDFPANVQVGEELVITIQSASEAGLEGKELARTLLNQILEDDQPRTL